MTARGRPGGGTGLRWRAGRRSGSPTTVSQVGPSRRPSRTRGTTSTDVDSRPGRTRTTRTRPVPRRRHPELVATRSRPASHCVPPRLRGGEAVGTACQLDRRRRAPADQAVAAAHPGERGARREPVEQGAGCVGQVLDQDDRAHRGSGHRHRLGRGTVAETTSALATIRPPRPALRGASREETIQPGSTPVGSRAWSCRAPTRRRGRRGHRWRARHRRRAGRPVRRARCVGRGGRRPRRPGGQPTSRPGSQAAHPACTAVAEEVDVAAGPEVAALVARIEAAHGPVDVFVANAGVGAGGGLDAPDDDLAAGVGRQPHGARARRPRRRARHARARRRLVRLDGQRRRPADEPRQRAVLGHQARRRRLRRVAGGDVRRAGPAGVVRLPDGRRHGHGARRAGPAGGRQRGRAGCARRWTTGVDAIMSGLLAGRFLVLTHPETATYEAAPGRGPGPLDRRDAAAAAGRSSPSSRRASRHRGEPRPAGQGAARGRGDVRRRRRRATTSPTTCCPPARPGSGGGPWCRRSSREPGCGCSTWPPAPGRAASRSAAAGAYAVPCDFSLGMLRVGKQRQPALPFVAGDALRLPFAGRCLRRGHHLVRPAQRARPAGGAGASCSG